MHFENEALPAVLKSTVQHTLTEITELSHNLWQILLIFGNLAALEFVECWTRALQV